MAYSSLTEQDYWLSWWHSSNLTVTALLHSIFAIRLFSFCSDKRKSEPSFKVQRGDTGSVFQCSPHLRVRTPMLCLMVLMVERETNILSSTESSLNTAFKCYFNSLKSVNFSMASVYLVWQFLSAYLIKSDTAVRCKNETIS